MPCSSHYKLKPRHSNIYYNVISLIVYYWLPPTTMDAVLATIVAGGQALIQLNIRSIKTYWFLIDSTNQTKSFNSGLGVNMSKAARPSGCVVSSNPPRWRGERLHHHGGGVCWLFVLLRMDSWRHKLIVCKIWYKNNPKEGLKTLLCAPPRLAPRLLRRSRKPLSEILASCLSKIKKPNKYC